MPDEPDHDELRRRLTAGRERLLQVIAGVTEQQFKQRPPATPEDAQPWCIAEVLAHLLDAERRAAKGVEVALSDDGAAITWWDQGERLERARAGRMSPVPQLIHGLLASRRELERLLERIDATSGASPRRLTDSQHGLVTIEWLLDEYVVKHEEEHVAQIESLREAVGARART